MAKKVKQPLRVWHIPQVPGKSFYVPVASLDEAVTVLDALARYDLFQLENNIKPDYANAQGLQAQDTDGDWTDWYDDDGDDIEAYRELRTPTEAPPLT